MLLSLFVRINNNTDVSNLEIVEHLQELQVIRKEEICRRCNRPMRILMRIKKMDDCEFYCHHRDARLSIRSGSLFFGSKLSLYEILSILNSFISDISAIQLSNNLLLSRQSVNKWYDIFRKKF